MLAIVIPYYNISFFEETLQSLSNQTNKKFKVYIGDDCSPDNPKKVIDKYENAIFLTYKRFENNLGQKSLSNHWKRCIKLINDEKWIMLLGDDDVLDADYVEQFYNQLEEIERFECNLIRFSTVSIDAESKKISVVFKHPKIQLATDAYFHRFKEHTRSSLTEYIFKKSVYEKHKFCNFPLAWHSDDMAWLNFTNCGNIYTINKAIAYIRLSESSISGQKENFKEKQYASYLFLKMLITQKLTFFKIEQRRELLHHFKKIVFKRKYLTFKNWFVIAYNLIKMNRVLAAMRFTRKFIIYKFK